MVLSTTLVIFSHLLQNHSFEIHAYNNPMIIKEIQSKSILSASKVYPYVINPYTGCQHSCSYCYRAFHEEVHRAQGTLGSICRC